MLCGHDVAGRALCQDASLLHQVDVVGDEQGVIRMVGRHENRQPLFSRQALYDHEQQHLVTEIEVRRRLVQEQDARLLRERAGDEHELPLTTTDLGVARRAQVAAPHGLERPLRDGGIA